MAEERLIDADKDTKYRIRKNADGEEELYVEPDGEEVEEITEFAVPEFDDDDEDAAAITPEQLADLIRKQEEEERKNKEEAARLKLILDENKTKGDWDGALITCDALINLSYATEWAYGEKLIALTHSFTDFSRQQDIIQTAEKVQDYATAEEKEQLRALLNKDFYSSMSAMQAKVDELNERNENDKAERSPVFKKAVKKAAIFFGIALIPFITFLVFALSYYSVMFASQDGVNIVYTAVFAGLTLIAFVVLLVATRKLVNASRLLVLNGKDSSTSVGREYMEENAKLIVLKAVDSALKIQVEEGL